MNVPVQREQRLVSLDRPADGDRTDRLHQHRPALDHGLERAVEHRRPVDRGPGGRDVQVEYRPGRIAHLAGQLLDVLVQVVLVHLPWRVPRGPVRPAAGDHLEPVAEVDQLVLRVGQDGGPAQVLAQLGRIVVAGHHVERDAAPGDLLLGPGHPPVQALEHELQEHPVHRVAVGPGLVELGVGGDERVEAHVPDLRLHLVELGGGQHLLAGDAAGHPPAVAGHDRHHRLAGDVAAHDQGVRAVEPGRVQELPPADIGAVDIGCEIYGARHLVTSSGTSYHRTRLPTLARIRQDMLFGASSITCLITPIRPAILAASAAPMPSPAR
jgi:hypothetical protein